RIRGIERAVWFVVGHRRQIVDRLKKVEFIGKKTSIGYGRVGGWEVENADEDWSWFAPSDDGPVLMRPLPAELVQEKVRGCRRWYGSPVPPYWQRNLFAEIMQPI